MLCIDCKYGHECRYMTTDNMEHALVVEPGEEVCRLMGMIKELFKELKARVKEEVKMSKGFNFGIELNDCQGYERGFKMGWDDEDAKVLSVLHLSLLKLYGDCRSKVGVRVPFEVYDILIAMVERFGLAVSHPGKIGEN